MGCFMACPWWSAAAEPREAEQPLTRIADVRLSSRLELAHNPPVRLRAVVTRATQSSLFIQDETAGIYVNIARSLIRGVMSRDVPRPEVPLGSEVEIEGVGDPGGYSPIILPRSITVLGPGTLPAPRLFDPATFFNGSDDSQFVEIPGIVQDAMELESHWRLSLEVLGRPFLASLAKAAVDGDPRDLIDVEVVVRGPTSSMSNTRGEFIMPWVFVERPDWLDRVQSAPRPISDCPIVQLEELARFHPVSRGGHRVRTTGTVIHVVPGAEVFLQDGATGIRVTTRDTGDTQVGDQVEAAGFPSPDAEVIGLAHGIIRRLASGPRPQPVEITPEEISAVNEKAVATALVAKPGDYSGCLVRFPARLVERSADKIDNLLVLSTESATVVARCKVDSARLEPLALGSLVEVTGIVSLDWEFDPLDWPRRRPRTVSLRMRSEDDVRVLEPPPFWTPSRLAAVLVVNAAALTLVAAWAWWLRGRRAELEALVASRTRELVTAREHEKQIEEEARITLAKKLRSSLSAAAIAHEINQPLSRILLRCRLGQRENSNGAGESSGEFGLAAFAADAEQVVTTIEKMNVLLRNVQTTHTEIDLTQVVRSSLFQVKQLLDKHDTTVRTTLPFGSCTIEGDDVQLQLAIVNLLKNSIEAIATGGGPRREIDVNVEDRPDAVIVEVSDSGPGWPGGTIEAALLATTKTSGAGVGLFVVSTAVENHRGTVEIGDSPLGGAVFRLTFPRSKDRPRRREEPF
jgi:signal transduction histidine kinase